MKLMDKAVSGRELSVFQLGLRWLKRCVSTNIDQLAIFIARLSSLKLSPVGKSGAKDTMPFLFRGLFIPFYEHCTVITVPYDTYHLPRK